MWHQAEEYRKKRVIYAQDKEIIRFDQQPTVNNLILQCVGRIYDMVFHFFTLKMSLLLSLLWSTFISEQKKLAEDVLLHKQQVAQLIQMLSSNLNEWKRWIPIT